MDKLFSSIQENLQENLQQNNQSGLLQKQQISQDKINELLEKSAESIMCGPACQKLKITEELKKKYLDAQTNLQIAPIKLEQTKKNFVVYTEGTSYYDNILEEELKLKSEKISELLGKNFNDEITSALTMNTYLNTALINSSYTKELLKSYTEKNQELQLLLRNRHGDILTNDRKTYYETDALSSLQLWYQLWWYIYYILLIVLIIAFFISPNNLSTVSKIVIAIILMGYPYYIDYIVRWIKSLFIGFYSNLPKNVYNDL
jgi:hypothetical protein